MPLLNGLDAGYQAKQLLGSVKLLFLTMNADPTLAAEAFRRRASGYVLKTCAAAELIRAVRGSEGQVLSLPCNRQRNSRCLVAPGQESIEEGRRLSERQREVLQLLTEGKSMKEVAYVLNVTTSTVAFHKLRIKEILDAKNDTP